ncbi:uncharacterized protein LOC114340906 [Diabrotica virgifera virgifera]|uniref:SAP domain-containing protein n=1 Tax=Diabrotica virgifera virgifera TaxID=50390 RepID=A0ABM5IXP5_DIAVI|nr:uncharacterized protein LOC114340906 [Diabrotica virgifera virgifera]
MSSQYKPKVCDLRVTELRIELEIRELDSAGKKADLLDRLKNALKEEDHDPETYVFEDRHAALISSISNDITSLENKVSGDITSLENKVSSGDVSKVSANITSLEHRASSDILKVSGDISSLESKMTDEISASISKSPLILTTKYHP